MGTVLDDGVRTSILIIYTYALSSFILIYGMKIKVILD